MPNACSVPSAALDFGKYSCANTNPVTVLYRKKSYHSIVVPTVLAITARVSCLRPSGSEYEAVKLDTGTLPRERPRAGMPSLFDSPRVRLQVQRRGDAEGARAPGEVVFLRRRRSGRVEPVGLRLCVVGGRVRIEQVVAERGNIPTLELDAGAQRGIAGGGQRVREAVLILGVVVRILHRREPGVAAGVFPVGADEYVVIEQLEGVLRAERDGPRRARARRIVDRRVPRDG